MLTGAAANDEDGLTGLGRPAKLGRQSSSRSVGSEPGQAAGGESRLGLDHLGHEPGRTTPIDGLVGSLPGIRRSG